jgi:pimeloyl-ACP methyl ester carboxylesterase
MGTARSVGRRLEIGIQAAALIVPDETQYDRRAFLGTTALSVAAARLGLLGSTEAQATDVREAATTATLGSQASLRGLKQIDAGVLSVAYAEAGPPNGTAVLLLHGWPYDVHSFVEVSPLLASKGYRVIVPYTRGYGATRFLSASTVRNGQPSAVALDALALMDALGVEQAVLAGFDWGARTADIIAALHPERCKALVSVSGYLIGSPAAGKQPLPPAAELQWWYQFYFATDRGRAGYDKNRHDFNKLIWKLASPKWNFDDATFDRSAAAFDNPDHVEIVIHNYRWRLGLAEGERRYDDLERQLAKGPVITVPTITLEGDANGAPHSDPTAYHGKFSGKYEHRTLSGGIGHNLPQEAPQAFAKAVVDADHLA